eukprot:Rmarinus@m.12718
MAFLSPISTSMKVRFADEVTRIHNQQHSRPSNIWLPNTQLKQRVTLALPSTAGASSTLGSVLPFLCFGNFFFLQISGLKTLREIQRNRDTGLLSILPFLSLAVNCIIWVIYGILRKDIAVVVPNVSGMILGAYYTYNFTKYCRRYPLPQILVSLVILAAVFILAAVGAVDAIGYIGSALAIALLSSPLATLKTVLKMKNTKAMPRATSIATFLNSLSWTLYGYLVAEDAMIWAPNFLGLCAATLQCFLLVIYPAV